MPKKSASTSNAGLPDVLLTPGVLETGSFGNKFNGVTDDDGLFTAGFTASGDRDMALRLTGFDIDSDTEIEVFVNGVSIGYLSAGVNNATQIYVLTIPEELLVSGDNTITFAQTGPVSWMWGITDLLIEPVAPVAHLTQGVAETGSWGNLFDGAMDADGSVSMTFDAAGDADLQLSFDGYDIDWDGEVEVFVNGVSVGALDAGLNEGSVGYDLILSADVLVAGTNEVTFRQMTDVTFKWGVTNIVIDAAPPPEPDLVVGQINTADYGNRFNGTLTPSGQVDFTFQNTGSDLVLSLSGYDIDWGDEVAILLNGSAIGFLGEGVNNALSFDEVFLSAEDLQDGLNTISFVQTYDANYAWGVTDLLLMEAVLDPAPPTLEIGVADTTLYGNRHGTTRDADGIQDVTFQNTGSDLVLSLSGYDIDWGDEVAVLLNGVAIGNLGEGVNNGLSSDEILLSSGDLQAGLNTISFVQAIDVSYTWGVTDLLLQEAAIDRAAPMLEIGVTDTTLYGNRHGDARDTDGVQTATFVSTGEALELSFSGYDIDVVGTPEVDVYLNGVLVGSITGGLDQDYSEHSLILSAEDQVAGTNTIEFRQAVDTGYTWGVTDLRLDPAPPPEPDLVVGQIDNADYGNNFNGNLTPGGQVDFTFQSTGSDLVLSLNGYDIDWGDEVAVLLNGSAIGYLSEGVNNALSFDEVFLSAGDLQDGLNTISFVQTYDLAYKWGVTDLLLQEAAIDRAAPMLEIGVTDTTLYGNRHGDARDTDGVQTATFVSTGEALELRVSGFDIDVEGTPEVDVFLNGVLVGTLTGGADQDYSQHKLILSAEDQVAGTNTIEFRQAVDTGYTWGVTDLRLDPALASYMPDDPNYADQWYLDAIGGMERLWADFTGAGVVVGIYDNGVQYTHHDLDGNYDTGLHASSGGTTLDPLLGSAEHGTAVAGIIAAENNGAGTVGIAFDATISGVNMIDGPAGASNPDPTGYIDAMAHLDTYDVVNHSWGATPGFDQTQETLELFAATVAAFEDATATGRGGLGTVQVKSAGNDGANSAGDMIDSSHTSITVGAVAESGAAASYSNHGANLLISAPSNDPFLSSLGIMTTDLMGGDGYTAGDYTGSDGFTGFGGTSAAAPIVTGVIALMLEANPDLGWRDIKSILAYSATHTGRNVGEPDSPFDVFGILSGYDWQINGADDWNGGGLHFSEDFGYGVVDAFTAVRMAEVWSLFDAAQTSANEVTHTATGLGPVTVQAGGYQSIAFDGIAMTVDSVEVTLSLSETAVEVFLVSAEGTRVQLLDDLDTTGALTSWTFGAEAFQGESGDGTWSLELVDVGAGTTLTDWSVTLFGAAPSEDDAYHYTDEVFADIIDDGFGNLSSIADDAGRMLLADAGGTDWLDLSGMTGNLDVSLMGGATSRSDGRDFLTIDAATLIENAVLGDGNDTLTGNDAANALHGMRGNDRIAGGEGDDLLSGGHGDDTFVFSFGDGTDTIADFEDGIDQIELWGFGIADASGLAIGTDADQNATVSMGGADMLVLVGVEAGQLGADDFSFFEDVLV